MKQLLRTLYFALCFALCLSLTAHAYIDPAAATFLVQAIAGVAIALGATFGIFWRKIKRLFSKKKDSVYQADFDDDDDDDDFGLDDFDDLDLSDVGESTEQKPAAVPAAPAAASVVTPASTVKLPATAALSAFDENASGDLAAENRLLRQLLAEEQEKVAILKKALAICAQDN